MKPTANKVFLQGLKYLFWMLAFWLEMGVLISVSFTESDDLLLTNVLMGVSFVLGAAYLLAFFIVYFATRQAIAAGETSDSNILTKNGKLNINIFKKKLDL